MRMILRLSRARGCASQQSAVQVLHVQSSARQLHCQLEAAELFAREPRARPTAQASAQAFKEAACSSSVHWCAVLQ